MKITPNTNLSALLLSKHHHHSQKHNPPLPAKPTSDLRKKQSISRKVGKTPRFSPKKEAPRRNEPLTPLLWWKFNEIFYGDSGRVKKGQVNVNCDVDVSNDNDKSSNAGVDNDLVDGQRRGSSRRRGRQKGEGVSARKLGAALWRLRPRDIVVGGGGDDPRLVRKKNEDRLGFKAKRLKMQRQPTTVSESLLLERGENMATRGGAGAELQKLSIEQLKAVKEQLDAEFNLLQDSLNNIRTATTRLEIASKSLHELSLRIQGKKMLVPLTASLYVPGTLDDSNKVLVDVGTGYFIEKTMSEGKDYCQRKINLLKSNYEQLVEVAAKKKGIADEASMILHAKLKQLAPAAATPTS